MGEVVLIEEPAQVKTSITVVDQTTGAPVPGVELVFVGILSGTKKGVADSQGKMDLELKNCPQVVGVYSPQHQPLFQFLEKVDSELTLKLAPQPTKSELSQQSCFKRDPAAYLKASRRLMEQLEVLASKESTYFRQDLYLNALVGTDFEQLVELLKDDSVTGEHRKELLTFNFESILRYGSKKGIDLLLEGKIETRQKTLVLTTAARLASDAATKDELYGDCALLLGELTGWERIVATYQVISNLLVDGRIEAAQSIAEDAWNLSNDLKRIASIGKKEILHEARYVLPVHAIVNLQEAIKLVDLTVAGDDQNDVLSEALLMHSLSKGVSLEKLLREHEVEFSTNQIQLFSPMSIEYGDAPYFGNWCANNAIVFPKSWARDQALLIGARHLPLGAQRQQLIELASESFKSQLHFNELVQFKNLQPSELDTFLFASFRNAPPTFAEDNLNRFGILVRLLAFRDIKLARQFMQSALDAGLINHQYDSSVNYGGGFTENEFLKSAAWVDPEFACEVAEGLARRFDREGPTYKLELLSGMIQALNQVRTAIE